jgi:hypothetical protein
MSPAEIEAAFVTSFPFSSTRKPILAGYLKHAAEVQAIVGSFQEFLDGSFVTNKNDPGDVDLVVLIDGDLVDNLPSADKDKLRLLISGPITKASHFCDAYFCPVYPSHHHAFASARTTRKYWMGEFGFDRQDAPKGIVLVDVKPVPVAVKSP